MEATSFDAQTAGDRRPSAPSLQAHIDSISQKSPPSTVHSAVPNRLIANTITPPATPKDANSTNELAIPQPPLFNNYLRALHNFCPQSGSVSCEDASLMNASLKEGDLILVHCVHANGWADGTVLNTGDRGWLPTNYCEPYDHPYLRILLNALTQFWDLLGSNEDDNLSTFVRQDYIRGLIAGVRFLLERADCLHRDANQVKKHVGVRRMRKGILADLSSLVQIAKRVQETISEPFAAEVVSVLLEELVTKAFKVVTRAVAFVDVWTQETTLDRSELERRAGPQIPATPPVDTASLFTDTGASEKSGLSPMIDSAMEMLEEKGLPTTTKSNTSSPAKPRASQEDSKKRTSAVFTPPDGRVAHRLSLVQRSDTDTSTASMASDRLAQTHDVCISHIAAFIGHHLHSRPYSELAATTDKLVSACDSMLAIVDEVRAHDPQKSASVKHARDDFHAKVQELASSIKEVCKTSQKPDDEVVILPEKSKHLIAIGTELIRNTGDCVVKTRQLIESIGDFELKGLLGEKSDSDAEKYAEELCDSPTTFTASPKRFSKGKRMSGDMLPPPPPPKDSSSTIIATDFAAVPSVDTRSKSTPDTLGPARTAQSIPPAPSRQGSSTSTVAQIYELPSESLKSPRSIRSDSRSPARKDSAGMSIAGSTETFSSSARESSIMTVSEVSTRATTPDQQKDFASNAETATITSFASAGSARSQTTDASNEGEAQVLHRTYANELMFNKDGQVTGGSLPALIEQLTTHDAAPDPVFVKTFFITFRKFCDPREVAQALISRYDYIGDSKTIGYPVRLRIFNIFKHWLETYWNPDADKDTLGDIRYFALHKLKLLLPSAGERLVELTRKIAAAYRDGTFTPGLGKIYMAGNADDRPPEPAINKQELNALRTANSGGNSCSVLDLDPMEVARQITLIVAKTFNAIHADELLSLDWGKSNSSKAQNVRQICLLNTDLAHLVAESILGPEDAKKRATVIKHWTKIAMACLELNNYDSVMGIMCTINSSVIRRLKKTWEQVSKKTRARLDELEKICDLSKNYSALRKRLESPTTPCLPFLGVYLSDLTFIFHGNSKKRDLPGSSTESGEPLSVINFDMYMRVAKVITHLQKFQTPYLLKEVPEMRIWIEAQLKRMRDSHDKMVSTLHQRSLAVEPKSEDHHRRAAAAASGSETPTEDRPKTTASRVGAAQQAIAERFDFRMIKGEKGEKNGGAS